jgi:uncharacterized repeat protein (TIGR01451 family)
VTFSQGSCDTQTSPTDFTCDLGSVGVGASAIVTATYTVPAGTPAGTYTNTVQAGSDDSPVVSASDANTVIASAGLSLSKSDGVSQVTAGDGVSYSYVMTVTNDGPSVASNVVVTDTWTAGFERGLVTFSQGSCDTQTSPTDFTCDLGSVGVGASAIITATYTVPAVTPAGIRINTVHAGSDDSPVVSASDVNTVVASAGLSLIKSDGVSQVGAGDGNTYSYVMTVTNDGPSLASNVVVTDTWAAGFERGLVTFSQGSCDTQTSPTDFTCDLGSVGVGASAIITATYTVPAGTPGGLVTNIAHAGSEVSAVVMAEDENMVILRADLGLSMLDNPDPTVAGGFITYTLGITNNGPVTAVGVLLTDTLPAGLAFIGSGSSPECNNVAGTVYCDLGNMASGADRQVIIKAQVSLSMAGLITNHASVASSTLDPDEADNQDEASTTVLDLTLPTVTWVLPVGDEHSYDVVCQVVRLQVNASDNIQVQRVRFYRWVPVGQSGYYIEIGIDLTAPYFLYFYTCDLNLGYNQIFVEAYDTWGNKSPRKRILLYKVSNEEIHINYLPAFLK